MNPFLLTVLVNAVADNFLAIVECYTLKSMSMSVYRSRFGGPTAAAGACGGAIADMMVWCLRHHRKIPNMIR